MRPQASDRWESCRRFEKAGNLVVAIDVWSRTTISMRKQVRRRHGGPRVDGAAVLREAAHHPQAVSPLRGLRVGRLGRPFHGKFCGDAGRAGVIGELDKSLQKASRQTQLVPEGATRGEIFIERRLQRAHIAAPGHGSAMPRSDAISTLA